MNGMDEPRPEAVATGEPKPEAAGTAPRSPGQILRPAQHQSRMEKTVGVLRTILPHALKLLPLLDGQVGTAVSNLIGPQSSPRQVAQTLLPLQEGLAQLEKQHAELRIQVAGQSAALKQIDEQIEAVRSLAAKTAEEQRNLAASLDKVRRRVNGVVIVAVLLLAVLVTVNVVVFVHVRRILAGG